MLVDLFGSRVWIGMPTVEGRERSASATAAMLSAAAGPPTVYRSELRKGVDNLRDNQRRMMLDAVSAEASLLHIEDDVAINAHRFHRALLRFLHSDFADRICTMYLPGTRFYPRRVLPMIGGKMVETPFKIVNARHFWGSQAVLVPRALVSKAAAHAASPPQNLDVALRNVAPIWSYLPNPVQHLDEPPAWSARGHRHSSVSYE